MDYLYNTENNKEYLEHKSIKHLCDKKLSIQEYDNVLFAPSGLQFDAFGGGLFDCNGKPIVCSFQRNGIKKQKNLYDSIINQDIKKIDKEVMYLGQVRNHWGSFIVDSIGMLWAINNLEVDNYVVMITQPELGDLCNNIVDFYKHLGIYEKIIIIKEPTIFRKVYIPNLSYIPFECWHKEYIKTIDSVVGDVKDEYDMEFEKVYFSRFNFSKKTKNEFGEDVIENLLRKNGFKIIYPEEHTLDEQIYIVNHCKIFASAGGSCAHNIIFAKNKPKFIIFNRMGDYQWHQWMINEMRDVDIDYIDAYIEPYKHIFKTTISGPFLYWINRNVQDFVKTNSYKEYKIGLFKKIELILKYTLIVIKMKLGTIKRKILK